MLPLQPLGSHHQPPVEVQSSVRREPMLVSWMGVCRSERKQRQELRGPRKRALRAVVTSGIVMALRREPTPIG